MPGTHPALKEFAVLLYISRDSLVQEELLHFTDLPAGQNDPFYKGAGALNPSGTTQLLWKGRVHSDVTHFFFFFLLPAWLEKYHLLWCLTATLARQSALSGL